MATDDQLRIAFERLARASKECLDTYERVCLQRPAEAQPEPAADRHARPTACERCPKCGQEDVDGVRWTDMVSQCVADICPGRPAEAPFGEAFDLFENIRPRLAAGTED